MVKLQRARLITSIFVGNLGGSARAFVGLLDNIIFKSFLSVDHDSCYIGAGARGIGLRWKNEFGTCEVECICLERRTCNASI